MHKTHKTLWRARQNTKQRRWDTWRLYGDEEEDDDHDNTAMDEDVPPTILDPPSSPGALASQQSIPATTSTDLLEPPPTQNLEREDTDEVSIPRDVMKFFDLEALDGEDEVDEPATVEDQDFIDDKQATEEGASIQSAFRPLNLAIDDSENPDEIVRNLRSRYGVVRARLPEDSDFSAPPNLPNAFQNLHLVPTIHDPELYRVKVHPGCEYAFIHWLYSLVPDNSTNPLLLSAFYRPDTRGWVYVETLNRKTLQWALQNQRVKLCDLVPVADRVALLQVPSSHLHPGWAKLQNAGIYDGDIGFVRNVHSDPALVYVVPRYHTFGDETVDSRGNKIRPPRRPFTMNRRWAGAASRPNTRVNRAPRVAVSDGSIFDDGLTSVLFRASQLEQRGIRPSESDLEFFRAARVRDLDEADLESPSLALHEGERFVIPAGRSWSFVDRKGKKGTSTSGIAGDILAIKDVNGERMAACTDHWDEDDDFKIIPVRFMSRSQMNHPLTLRLFDRVLIVGGLVGRGRTGRVVSIDSDGIVELYLTSSLADESSSSADQVPFEMCDLAICFIPGDWVDVVRGKHNGLKGLIVGFRSRGIAEVFLPPISTEDIGNVIQVPFYALKPSRPEEPQFVQWSASLPAPIDYNSDSLSQEIHSAKESSFATVLVQGSALRHCFAQELLRQDAKLRHKVALAMKTGREFFGQQVRVVGGASGDKKAFVGDAFKGQTGQVVGGTLAQRSPYQNSSQQESLEETVDRVLRGDKHIWRGAMMHVQLEGPTPRRVQVAIDHLQDTNTRLPLLASAHVPWTGPPRAVTPPPPPEEAVWLDTLTPRDPKEQMELDARKAEQFGTWLCQPALAGKRLDVQVDVSVVPAHWAQKWPKKLASSHGETGYVVMKQSFDPKRKKALAKIGVMASNLHCPVENLKPMRTLFVPHIHAGRESISERAVRVVVIGPDVAGNNQHLGQYARVMPLKSQLKDAVQVRFALPEGGIGMFPLFSLCRVLNRQPAGEKDMVSRFSLSDPTLNVDDI
ncbi:hypothetical protein R3P38DRAFT_3228921 [Favolaschia claudopus]|uniref:Uncharacterized protein n=1 Tax=Favolaschia claudopus TaxID=2862362 RepID=A0AAV9ZPB0_9AGAR